MSYCRWSSMDFQCDLYCYAHIYGGYTTHVAPVKRLDRPLPIPEPGEAGSPISEPEWECRTRIRNAWFDWYDADPANWRHIPPPHGGETYHDNTLEDFRDRLVELRAAGLLFPDDVFDRIADELAEDNARIGDAAVRTVAR